MTTQAQQQQQQVQLDDLNGGTAIQTGVVQTPAPDDVVADADTLALRNAEAELAAEEAATAAAAAGQTQTDGQGGAGDGQGAAEPGAAAATDPAQAAQAAAAAGADPAGGQGQPRMVPVERLGQETEKRRRVEDELLVERGRREALEALVRSGAVTPQQAAAGAPGGAPAQPQKTPEQQIKDIRSQQVALAKQFQQGEIGADDWEAKRVELDDKVAEIRTQALASHVTEEVSSPRNSEWLAAQTAALEANQDLPILNVRDERGNLFFEPEELKAFEPIAMTEMRRAGKPFDPRSPESVFEVRQRVAELAQHNFGYRLPADRLPKPAAAAAAAAASPSPTPAQPGKPVQPGVTADQRRAKAALAAGMPPDVTRAGTPAANLDATEEQVLNMTTSDWERMSEAERDALERKIMGT